MELMADTTNFESLTVRWLARQNEEVAVALGHKMYYQSFHGTNDTEVNGVLVDFQPVRDSATAFKLMVQENIQAHTEPRGEYVYVTAHCEDGPVWSSTVFAHGAEAEMRRLICVAIVSKYTK